MGFLSHIIEEMFNEFGCHQLEGGVGSLFFVSEVFFNGFVYRHYRWQGFLEFALSINFLVPLMLVKTTFKS